jgi:hypothetical protein
MGPILALRSFLVLGFFTGAVVGQNTELAPTLAEQALDTSEVFGLCGVGLVTEASDLPVLGCALPAFPTDAAFANHPWPGGTVPFEFDGNVSALDEARALAAMDVIHALARVTFVARTSQAAYLHIQADSGNSSTSVGYTGGPVTIRLFNWEVQGVVIHELFHALGFEHEQKRPDRNAYVTIVGANIQSGFASQFSIVSGALTAGPYDYESLMHYDGCAFSICCPPGSACACAPGCETILAPGHQDEIGNRSYVSALDAHGLRSLYAYSDWRFVDKSNSAAGNGTGTNPWRELSSALGSAPAGSTVFVMPATYSVGSSWSQALVIAAPVEGVVIQQL